MNEQEKNLLLMVADSCQGSLNFIAGQMPKNLRDMFFGKAENIRKLAELVEKDSPTKPTKGLE